MDTDEESAVEHITEWPVTDISTSHKRASPFSTLSLSGEPSLSLPTCTPFVHNHNFTFTKNECVDESGLLQPQKRKVGTRSQEVPATRAMPEVAPAGLTNFLGVTEANIDNKAGSKRTSMFEFLNKTKVNKKKYKKLRLVEDLQDIYCSTTKPPTLDVVQVSDNEMSFSSIANNNDHLFRDNIFGENSKGTFPMSDSCCMDISFSDKICLSDLNKVSKPLASSFQTHGHMSVLDSRRDYINQSRKFGSPQSIAVFEKIKPFNTSSRSKDVKEGRTPVLQAEARLARWWRHQGQHLHNAQLSSARLPETCNPKTLLFHVARLPEGSLFLKAEQEKLRLQAEKGEKTGSLLAALASVEELLGNTQDAISCLKQALELEPLNREWQWLLYKLERQQMMKDRQDELMQHLPSTLIFPPFQQVERVSFKDLSFTDFFHRFANLRKPVVITDFLHTMTKVPWDLKHIRDVAGQCSARVKRLVTGSVEWAELEDSRSVTVAQFLDELEDRQDYLFDWSLPINCQALAEELIIPRYFAGDFLQRTSVGSLYRDSWPSLFIAPPGLHGGLHIDAFASNFWMALFQGRKRWVFFGEEDTACLYPIYAHSLDPTFEVKVSDPDLEAHSLLALTHPVECVLNAGEILFVPSGCPHYVENLDTTLAISANFVDLSNFRKVIEELKVNSLVDPRAEDLLGQFLQPSFPSVMRSGMSDLPWTEFHAWAWSLNELDLNSYDITENTLKK